MSVLCMSHNNHTPACMHAVSRQDMHCHYQPDMLCQSAFAEAGPYLHGKQAVLLWTLQAVTYNRVCKYRSAVTGSRSANCFENDNALLVGADAVRDGSLEHDWLPCCGCCTWGSGRFNDTCGSNRDCCSWSCVRTHVSLSTHDDPLNLHSHNNMLLGDLGMATVILGLGLSLLSHGLMFMCNKFQSQQCLDS